METLFRQWLTPVLIGLITGGLIVLVWMTASDSGAEPEPDSAMIDRPGYSTAVARAAPAVVNIYSRIQTLPHMCLRDPRLQPWCDRLMGADRTSLGSGVVVHPDGYIVTNAHVIEGASEVLVMLADGRTAGAALVGKDDLTDLAVIQIPLKGLTPITLGSSAKVAVGDIALAIGNPFGIGQTVSAGIISAKGRASVSRSPYDDFLQTDAAINPGNSGGALIDANGYLIGINTLIFSPSGQSIGVGFALPGELAYQILGEIIENGHVTRGWLGLTLENRPLAPTQSGLRITAIEPRGPAAAAGLLPHDLIVAVNGQTTSDPNSFSRAVGRTRPGQEMRVEIIRPEADAEPLADPLSGRALVFSVVAGQRPEPQGSL